jgi:hypothetical protein
MSSFGASSVDTRDDVAELEEQAASATVRASAMRMAEA